MVTGQLFMTLKQTKTSNNNIQHTYKELSIQIHLNGLSFCVYNTSEATVETLLQYPLRAAQQNPETLLGHLKETIDKNEPLQQKFDVLRLIYVHNLSALVPEVVFDEDQLKSYLKYNVTILANDYISYDSLAGNEIKNVYIPYVNINNYMLDWHGSFEYQHFSTILIEKILTLGSSSKEKQVFLHFTSEQAFQIIVTENKKLLLYNHFDFQTKEDFIYYLLFVYEQLVLDPEIVPLTFVSNLSKKDPLFEIAYTYIRNVTVYQPAEGFKNIDTQNYLDNFVLLNSFT